MGSEMDFPVVRAGDARARAEADGHGFKELFVIAAGPHPTGVLYGYIVEAMLPRIVEVLKDWHRIDLDAEVGKDG